MDLTGLAGALALVRMRPVLEVAGTPFLAEIDSIVAACGALETSGCAKEVRLLRAWKKEIDPVEDAFEPIYFQSAAADLAVLVASQESDVSDREFSIRVTVGNFWNSCDSLLHARGGYSRAEYKGIKTTPRGVENMWCDRDVFLLSEGRDNLAKVFAERLSEIYSKYPKRKEIARIIAECGGWDIPANLS